MNHTECKGYLGEWLTILLLICKGYRILKHRYKTPYGEIDIIAKKRRTISFIEVKSRNKLDQCFDAITKKQLQRIQNASEIFMASNKKYSDYCRSYDVALVANWSIPVHITNITN